LRVAKNQKALMRLVAGVGFEPTTFRLWAWRTYRFACKMNNTTQIS